ncbi:MAG: metallophosphoesterase [Oscillospiraceae bacterium]|jgi:hypothetical protein|nr:metallophosphoesterase [Oscillospiraceae bacterium]
MKKHWKRLLLIVLALALVCGGTAGLLVFKKPFHNGDLTGEGRWKSIVGRVIPAFFLDENAAFDILQLTDTHLVGNTGKDQKTMQGLREMLTPLAPRLELVVVTGDMLDGFNRYIFVDKRAALERIAGLFEELGLYWAYVPGNNDGEYLGSAADVAAALSGYAHCIIANEEGLTGATQYAIPLRNAAGKTVHTLVFMDSLARDPETHYITYDHFKPDQAAWLDKTLANFKAEAPNGKATLFFHMNTPAMLRAAREGSPAQEGYAPIPESFTYTIEKNAPMDDVIAKNGNVGLVSIGHIHPERSWCSALDGVLYQIARPAGYEASQQPGAVLITVEPAAPEGALYHFEEMLYEAE